MRAIYPLYSDGVSHIDKSNKSGIVFLCLKGLQASISQLRCMSVMSLIIVFTLTNSVDPDEMPHNAAFHQVLHCLSKYPFRDSRWFIALHNIDSCIPVYTYRPGLASINGEH